MRSTLEVTDFKVRLVRFATRPPRNKMEQNSETEVDKRENEDVIHPTAPSGKGIEVQVPFGSPSFLKLRM